MNGYAELAVIDATLAASIGPAISFTAAAATPLAAGTAQDLLARLALPADGSVLVLGCSGGVGLFVLQLAAAAGIMTIGVGRLSVHEQMLSLGASFCIDYTQEDGAGRAVMRRAGASMRSRAGRRHAGRDGANRA